MEVLARRSPLRRLLGWGLYLLTLPLAAFSGLVMAALIAWASTGFRDLPQALFIALGIAGTLVFAIAAFQELCSRDYSEVRLEDGELVVIRGRQVLRWRMQDLQEFRVQMKGVGLRGPDNTRVLLREFRPEALVLLRDMAVPAMAAALGRRLDAGETIAIRQPLAPLVAALGWLAVMAGLGWLLTATVFRAPGPGWAFVAVCALVGLWILPQLRTGGMTVTREGLRSRRRGDLVPWADVQELRGTATALKLVTRQETFTLAQAGSPEPLAMVLAERIQAARGDATD